MEELVECICDYVRRPYTDYAVMINGEWGSGKTYFWDNKLRSRLESITVNGKKYKTIYMSLYGINSLEEISKKIFIETNPMISKSLRKFIDTRQGNLIPEYVKTGLDMANLFGNINMNSDKLDFSKLFAIDDKILCFDDLERANVDVIDILGYINNFVEHDGIKTILICNEKELATKFKNTNIEFKSLIATYILDKEGKLSVKNSNDNIQKNVPIGNLIEDKISEIFDRANAYERIKEKLIGETFEYVPEYAYILSGMIMKFSYNEALSDFLKRNNSLIIAAFKKSNTRNLRILKHAINDFERIYDSTMTKYPEVSYEILKTMLTFTIAISFEIKSGNISKEKLKNISSNEEYNSVIFTSQIMNDKNQFYLREFDNKYFLNSTNKYRFFKFIEVYVRTRFFDDKIFREDMDLATARQVTQKEDENKKYLKLLSGEYYKMSDVDFEILWKQVLEEVKYGKVSFKEHIKLFAVYKHFINTSLIKFNVSELKQIFILGMQISSSENIKQITSENFELESAIDYVTDDKDIEDMKIEFSKIRQMAIEEAASKKAKQLFRLIPNEISEFYKQIMGEYKDLPVFARYDMEDLFEKLLITSNYDIYNIINLLNLRYKDKNELLKNDIKSLKKLSELLSKYIRDVLKNQDKTIKIALFENMCDTIKKLESEV